MTIPQPYCLDMEEAFKSRCEDGYDVTCTIDDIGVTMYTLTHNGLLHRGGDKPAVIYPNGDQCWYFFGKRDHGGDKPAVIYTRGLKAWYRNGKLYRDGGKPTLIYSPQSSGEEHVAYAIKTHVRTMDDQGHYRLMYNDSYNRRHSI